MGQEKQRDSRQSSIAAAQSNRVQTPVSAIRKEFNLPDNAEYLGCVVWLRDSDEFLATIRETPAVTHREYTKTPALAMQFESREDADAVAEKIPHAATSAILFDLGDQYYVACDS